METFDSIIVGAGAAGCVVARRLADAGDRTLLIEAGPARAPSAVTSVDAVAALEAEAWLWPEATALTDGIGPRPYRRGRGLGGSTAVNTLVITPGDPIDYDRWAADYGCPGWDWAAMSPWLAAAAERLGPATVELGPLADVFAATAEVAGHRVGGTSGEPGRLGFLAATLAIAGHRRRSAADAYLSPPPAGLTVRTGAEVGRVVFDRRRAVGVELGDGSRIGGDRIVVSAGALNTPVLLRRSGVDEPLPGSTVEDHPSFSFTLALRPETRNPVERAVPPITGLLRWPVDGGATGGDAMALVMDHVGLGSAGRRYGAVIVTLTDVRSRGELEGGDRPAFAPGWLRHHDDRRRFRVAVREVAAMLADGAVSRSVDGVFIDDRGTPIDAVGEMSDSALDRWLGQHPGPVGHVGASCPLGASPGAVVDLDGRLRGYERIMIVDASVFPHLPSANPQLPVMAVAERLSAALIERG